MTSNQKSYWERGRVARAALTGLAIAGLVATLPASADAATPPPASSDIGPADWASAGGDIHNTRSSPAETAIGPNNVAGLKPKWTVTTGGSVSASPTVVNGFVYAPDWAGNLYKVQAETGAKIWTHKISDYTGVADDMSRNSPAYADGMLVTGDGAIISPTTAGAFLMGIDAVSGAKRWSTRVDDHPAAIITGSPVVSGGIAYVGISSKTEGLPDEPSFRGSMVAVDIKTGKLLWKTYVIPEGYTGGAIWGSNPVVDEKRGLVYVGTGNNYTTPDGICTFPDEKDCVEGSPENHQDAIVAFDVKTGGIVWATHTLTADTWTIAKQFGPDFDFGASPNLYTTVINGKQTDLLGIGQKSGVYWALDPSTGKIVWNTVVGPGSSLGGIEWGTATDGKHIYAAITNADGIPTKLTSATGQTSTTTAGFWASIDAATGKVAWQTAVPGASAPYSFVSEANGLVYSGTLNPQGDNMYALDAATGLIKWSFASGGTVLGGAAIVDGSVYWGSGYPTLGLGFPFNGENNKLYGFSLPRTTAAPQTVYVSPKAAGTAAGTSCDSPSFTSVNAAIRAVASGGRVVVCDGTFHENVAVNKPLALDGRTNATIDATNLINGVTISASDVTMTGFTVQHAIGEGVLVYGADHATIANNIVSDNNRGTGANAVPNSYLQCASTAGVPGDCGAGIHLMGSSNSNVLNNTGMANAGGILVSDETGPAAHNVISGNSLLDNTLAHGIALAAHSPTGAPGGVPAPSAGGVFDNTVSNNVAANNGLAGSGGGIGLVSRLTGGAVYNNTVEGNILGGNALAGVVVHSLATGQDMNGNVVRSNRIDTNNVLGDKETGGITDPSSTGVLVSTGSPLSIQITGNTISNDHFGIWTRGPVTAANATSNTFASVDIHVSAN